jgi:CO dehydrogenase/acetyl-CoA synthase epsilon subunit
MKRFTLIALFVSAIAISAFAGGKQPTTFKKTPKNIQKAVLANYTDKDVLIVTSEKGIGGHTEYTLILSDETKLKYNEKAVLRSAKNANGIKEVFIPKNIQKYLTQTFPNATVTEYEWERAKQEVTLNNKLELVFDKRGKFLRVED